MVDIFFYIIIFLLGIAVGSFVNVLVDRLPNGQSIWRGRSHCDVCKKTLAWYDLIPIFSFALLGAKCRYCHSPLSWQYPTVELLTGILFVGTGYLVVGPDFQTIVLHGEMVTLYRLLYSLLLASALFAILVTDVKYYLIPDRILLVILLVTLVYSSVYIPSDNWLIFVISAFGAFAFFGLIFILTRGRGMGFGDVKLSFVMGLLLGFPNIVVALYVAFLTGAVVSTILVLGGKRKFFGGTIPFGPFLVLGTYCSFFWGDQIVTEAIRLLLVK